MGFKIVYEPKGRAKEYADLALNIYDGCNFGCTYCYAPLVLKKDRDTFHAIVKAKDNILEKVKKDCELGLIEDRKVLLCFTCDPYQDIDNDLQLTREVLQIFKQHNVSFIVLTKSGLRAIRDFDLYKPSDSFGSTLTFQDKDLSRLYEPNASNPECRFDALRYAHEAGIKTWVSLEPVIDPVQTLEIIKFTHAYVDLYKVGTLNYSNKKNIINWYDFGKKAIELLECYGKEYYIKDDLKAFLAV